MAIPLHRVQSGALLLFSFFIISDPRTTPDSRAGRILFGCLVAAGAWWIQFRLFRTNGPLWSLAACSLLTPLIDWALPGRRFRWQHFDWSGGISHFHAPRPAGALTPLPVMTANTSRL